MNICLILTPKQNRIKQYYKKSFIFFLFYEIVMNTKIVEEYEMCKLCNNTLPHCHCKCPYCGERDKCECALFDAATGG